MKTIDELLRQEPVYLNDWSNKAEVEKDFTDYGEEPSEYLKNANVLFATYSYANYSGDAFVLLERDGKLFEVNGGHCSCYGLEGQWDEEEVVLPELEKRLTEGSFGSDDWTSNNFRQELCEFLGVEYVEPKSRY